MNMTTIFDAYDEEYKVLTKSISTQISQVISYEEDPEKKISLLNHVGDLIKQANQLIQQMDLEVRSLEEATKRELTKKVSQYRSSLKSLTSDYKKLREKEERNGLFGDRDIEMTSQDHRSRMEAASARLNATSDKINAARQTVADTEEVALAITDELGRNREKIEGTREKVRSVNELARSGGRIIGRMTSRERKQKCLLYVVMAFLVIAIIIILYMGVFGSGSSNDKK